MRAEPKGGAQAPVLAAVMAGLLLTFVLPNPFFSPSDRTQAQAEYAPVPGPAPKVAAANFSQTQTPVSKGLGELPNAFVPNVVKPALPEFAPRMKECVGNPPRQTEDPMSPPCVPFFDGPNGGKTWQGVTKDRIDVVMYVQSLEKELDLSEAWKPSDEATGSDHPSFQHNLARTLKAHYRYFQQRYQTYGREVRVRAVPSIVPDETTGSGTPFHKNCAQQREEAREAARAGTFAAASVAYWLAPCFRHAILEEGMPFFGPNYDVAREEYLEHAPLLWGFFPDQQTQAQLAGSFLCRSLAGRTARFANDPNPMGLTAMERKFAILYFRGAQTTGPGSVHEQVSRHLVRAAHACGVTIEKYPYDGPQSDVMVRLKQDDITTLIFRGIAFDITTWQNKASAINYFPEWFWEQPMAVSYYGNTYADRKQSGFGISPRWRHPAFRQQVHYRAYKSMERDSTPNPIWSADIYYTLHTLFSAIQSAGPHLTPANIEAGMFTMNLVQLDNPWVPSGGWGPYGPRAVNNYTFVDTAMAWWGDFAGQQPGGAPGEGCFRASLEGRRFFAGQWPRGDKFLYREEDPCYHGDIEGVDDK